jgi:hypothetical protein
MGICCPNVSEKKKISVKSVFKLASIYIFEFALCRATILTVIGWYTL